MLVARQGGGVSAQGGSESALGLARLREVLEAWGALRFGTSKENIN